MIIYQQSLMNEQDVHSDLNNSQYHVTHFFANQTIFDEYYTKNGSTEKKLVNRSFNNFTS